MQGDLRRAEEAHGDAAAAGSARSITSYSVILPRTRNHSARAGKAADEGDAAGEADLAAVGMAAEHEVGLVGEGLAKGIGSVCEKDPAGALGDVLGGALEVVGLIVGGVVDAGEVKALAVALEVGALIEEHRQADGFEHGNLTEEVVVAEDAEARAAQGGDDRLGEGEGLGKGAGEVVAEIAGDDGGVVVEGAQELDNAGGESGVGVEVKVRDLQEAEPVEGAGEAGEVPGVLLDAKVAEVAAGALPEACGFEEPGEEVEGALPQGDAEVAVLKGIAGVLEALAADAPGVGAGAESGLELALLGGEWLGGRGHGR